MVRAQLAALPHAHFAMMSGSGSTLFAVLHDDGAAPGLLALPHGWTMQFTETAPLAPIVLD